MNRLKLEDVTVLADVYGSALGIGGIRTQSFTEALASRGVTVSVFVRRVGHSKAMTPSLARTSLKHALARRLTGVLPAFTPDVSVQKWNLLVPQIRSILDGKSSTVLYSSGPPHSIHVAAMQAKRAHLWIADLRDPIDLAYSRRSKIVMRHLHAVERAICDLAVCVLVASESHLQFLRTRYPNAWIELVENGFPDELLPLKAVSRGNDGPLRVGLVGAVRRRHLARLVEILDGVQSFEEVEILYYGPNWKEFQRLDRRDGIRFILRPPAAQSEVIAAMKTCSLLVNARGPQRELSFSSKYFEFAALGLPILAIGVNAAESTWLGGIPQAVIDDYSKDPSEVGRIVLGRVYGYQPEAAQVWLDRYGSTFSRRARWSSFLDVHCDFPDTAHSGSIRVQQLGKQINSR